MFNFFTEDCSMKKVLNLISILLFSTFLLNSATAQIYPADVQYDEASGTVVPTGSSPVTIYNYQNDDGTIQHATGNDQAYQNGQNYTGSGADPTTVTAPAVTDDKTWVFILAGQSNMEGRGQNVDQYSSATFFKIPENVTFISQGMVVTSHAGRNPFGPEITVINRIANTYPTQKMIFIKYAIGGTFIDEWLNTHLNTVLQYTIAYTQHLAVDHKGFLWMQGENDTMNPSIDYSGKLLTLFKTVKDTLKSPDIRFIVGSVRAGGLITTKQFDAVSKEPNAKIVVTDNFTLNDTVHFDGPSQISFGNCLGVAFFEDQNKDALVCPARYVDVPVVPVK